MLKIDFTEKAIDDVYQQFMEQSSGPTKKKLHVVYLKALGFTHKDIERIARINDQLESLLFKIKQQHPHITFCHFKAAIDCLDKVKSVFKEQVKTLLNPKFQLFGKSAGVTA